MSNTIGFGQAAVNNTIDYGQGATDNTINWGKSQTLSPSGETNITGGGGTPSFSNVNSFSFDGVDDYFIGTSTYSELDGQNKMTLSLWMKPISGAPLYEYVVTVPRNSTANEHVFSFQHFENNYLNFSIDGRTARGVLGDISAINYGQWNHVLCCLDGTLSGADRMRIYINGVDETYQANIGTFTALQNASGGLMIGEEPQGAYNPYKGFLDEVAIWSGTDQRANVSEIYGGGQAVDLNNLATAPQPTTWQRMGEDATWNGATWTMTDVNGGYTNRSINMVEANRTTDVPTIPFSTKSIALDGVDDYINVADNSNLSFGNGVTDSPFSISTWVKMDDATKFRALGKYGATNVEYLLATGGDDKIVFYLYQNSTAARIGRKYDTALTSFQGQWIHLAITYNGNSSTSGLKIYLNGTRVDDTNITSGTYVAMENTTQPLYIGKLTTTYANGNVDETAIFNSELSQSDVNSIYGGGSPSSLSSYSSLVSWWRCGDGDTAPTLTDNGSGGNDGTMTNFTTFSTDVPT